MLVRPLSTVDNTRDYARVSHSRQWSNYNVYRDRAFVSRKYINRPMYIMYIMTVRPGIVQPDPEIIEMRD